MTPEEEFNALIADVPDLSGIKLRPFLALPRRDLENLSVPLSKKGDILLFYDDQKLLNQRPHSSDFPEELFFTFAKKMKSIIQPEESKISLLSEAEFRTFIEVEQQVSLKNGLGAPGSPSVLSAEEKLAIANESCRNEHQLIVCFTPTLEALSAECGLVFVNTEEHTWVRTLSGDPKHYQKPDGLSTLPQLYDDVGMDKRVDLDSWKLRYPTTYRYGRGIWEIRDFYVIWEFKVKLSPSDRGKAYSYLLHLCREDQLNTYQCILCDLNEFYIVKARCGIVVSVEKWEWVQEGSRQALLDTLSFRNSWFRLFSSCCSSLKVSPMGFLGSGGYGRVFRVRCENGCENAMKIALTLGPQASERQQLIASEFDKLSQLMHEKVPNVIPVVLHSLTWCAIDDMLMGAAYLQPVVGVQVSKKQCQDRDFCERLLFSLMDIHKRNYNHGDARFKNAILYENNILWIDFVSSNVYTSSPSMKREDIKSLLESIFDDADSIAHSTILSRYGENSNEEEERNILRGIVDLFFSH